MSRLEKKILSVIIAVLVFGCFIAISIVVSLQKSSLYEVSTLRASETVDIIARNVERSMLEGKADATMVMINDYGRTKGIEEIALYNSEGREAFNKTGPVTEVQLIRFLKKTKEPKIDITDNTMVISRPLLNTPVCQGCHGPEKSLLGAIRIRLPVEKENQRVSFMFWFSILASIAAVGGLSVLLLFIMRRLVIRPISKIEKAASLLSEGDLSFSADIKARDEIGRLSESVRGSLLVISGILKRIQDVSKRITKVAGVVENESRRLLDGTQLESESIENISSSVEELKASIFEISEGTDSLAASVEETAASMEQMSSSISQISSNTSELFTAVEDSSSSIEEMSLTIKAVAESADKLSVSSADTLSAVEELNSSIREVDRNAKDSAELSQKVVEDASHVALPSVEKTFGGMKQIKNSVEKTADSVRKLGERSGEIGKILNVIDEITEQTTLLSLNAAILASQAGEHGKGFSVVADEIKDLAERTSFSTQEIGTLIGTVQQEVSEAVSLMEEGVKAVEEGFKLAGESDKTLRMIVESAEASSGMSSAIERTTAQQSKAVGLVSESMEKVKNMIASIVRATSEQAKGASLIIGTIERVRDITTQLKRSSEEQTTSVKRLSNVMEVITDRTQQISVALREQKEGAGLIKKSVETINLLPEENRERAFTLNKSLKDLYKDAELVLSEMQTFSFYESSDADVIHFGVVPLESPSEMFNKFNLLIEYLGEKLNKKVELKVAVDFANAVDDICSGNTQMCFMTPSTYIKAYKEAGVRVIVKAVRDGKPYQHSVVVANRDSDIEKIEDVKGKSFGFGDVDSTSSHIVPRYMLMEAGIKLDDLRFYNYLGGHDDVAEAVFSGDFDAGGIMESTAVKYEERGLKLIKFSEEIPEFNICVGRQLPEETVERIRRALIDLSDADIEKDAILKSIDPHYTGFTEADDSDYNRIRDIMLKLGMV